MPKIFGAATLMKSHPNGLGGASRQPGRKASGFDGARVSA
jgi:hypothetical protein